MATGSRTEVECGTRCSKQLETWSLRKSRQMKLAGIGVLRGSKHSTRGSIAQHWARGVKSSRDRSNVTEYMMGQSAQLGGASSVQGCCQITEYNGTGPDGEWGGK
jgi:hypothetical protein